MGATSWTEMSQSADVWQEGLPGVGIAADDYFIDFLMEGSTFFDAGLTWTEMSQSADAMTEMSQSATSWTEMSA